MIDDRERNRLERWGAIKPEPLAGIVDHTGTRIVDLNANYDRLGAELDAPPRPPAATTNRLDAIRVWTAHETAYQPLCPRCRRPYNPDSPLMAPIRKAGLKGCCSCAPLTYVFDLGILP